MNCPFFISQVSENRGVRAALISLFSSLPELVLSRNAAKQQPMTFHPLVRGAGEALAVACCCVSRQSAKELFGVNTFSGA
jgi:hypothetical protein